MGATIALLFLGIRWDKQIRARQLAKPSAVIWLLSDVATRPGRHIGDCLMTEVLARAAAANAIVCLKVNKGNMTAIHLYERHGWQIVGDFPKHINMQRHWRTADSCRLP